LNAEPKLQPRAGFPVLRGSGGRRKDESPTVIPGGHELLPLTIRIQHK
jgi:hypothetical protein